MYVCVYGYMCIHIFDFFPLSLAVLNNKGQRPNSLPVSVVLVSIYPILEREAGDRYYGSGIFIFKHKISVHRVDSCLHFGIRMPSYVMHSHYYAVHTCKPHQGQQ